MGTFGTPSSYNNTGALGSATNPTTAQGLSRDRENQKAILELPGTQAWVEKTITDGVIIPTSAEVIVLPEGGAPTDSLTTITLTSDGTTTLHEGMTIRLKAANSDTITAVHGAGTNNISTIDGNNVVLDTTWYLELKLINGLWVQQETSAYKTANEAKTSAATALSTANGAYVLSGTSSTSSSVAAKDVTLSGYELRVGSVISVVFSNANTVADAITLNVNGTGAKSVYNQTGIISTSNTALFAANQPIEFRYGGTGWVFFDAKFGAQFVGDLSESFATTRPGSLLCNGGAYSRTTYAALFALLGTAFGAGDGSTTFNVPDFRGRTIQGANANLMAVLAAGLPEIQGGVTTSAQIYETAGPFTRYGGYGTYGNQTASLNSLYFKASASNPIYGASATVQPPAIAANIFIKY